MDEQAADIQGIIYNSFASHSDMLKKQLSSLMTSEEMLERIVPQDPR